MISRGKIRIVEHSHKPLKTVIGLSGGSWLGEHVSAMLPRIQDITFWQKVIPQYFSKTTIDERVVFIDGRFKLMCSDQGRRPQD